jgi:hypothetical protein
MRARVNSMALARGGGGVSSTGVGGMKEAHFVMDDDEGAELPDYQLGDESAMFSLGNIRPITVKAEPGLGKSSSGNSVPGECDHFVVAWTLGGVR